MTLDKQRPEYRMIRRCHTVLYGRLVVIGCLLGIGAIYFGALFWWVT